MVDAAVLFGVYFSDKAGCGEFFQRGVQGSGADVDVAVACVVKKLHYRVTMAGLCEG